MKTNICLSHTGYSQFNQEAIDCVNNMVDTTLDDISFSCYNPSPDFTEIKCAVFSPNVLDSFCDGVVITSNISHANDVLGCSTNAIKVLYLYDLTWMFKPTAYDLTYKTLNDKNLHIILRSDTYKKPILDIGCKRPITVIEKFSLEEIWNLL
mgnify:CR=1 FL=1